MRLKGKYAVITGGGSGIGEATALLFAKEGAKVAVTGRTESKLKNVVEKVHKEGGEAIYSIADSGSVEDVKKMKEEILASFQRVDILVNSAGLFKKSLIEEFSIEDWDAIIRTNLRGTFLCCQAFGREMIKQKSGNIVNVASLAGHMPQIFLGAYGPSKAAIKSLTKLCAVEWVDHNIRVNSVSPGTVMTPFISGIYTDQNSIDARAASIPMKRFGTPEEVAYSILFLASDESSHITGEDIVIDGGALPSYYRTVSIVGSLMKKQ